jgi:glucose-1-phosphate thymidylyltransferase|tara:strand:+ start:4413 stop:5291 length:879 start_codon:yes stop_codon:yes gene_type:complete
MKGIILAGGTGSRLFPVTKVISKQLLPIFDKPMIYYPLSVLMHAGIKEILIISTPSDLPKFKDLLGDGSRLGIEFEYLVQPSPDGIAQALILGSEFIKGEEVCLILGDNLFYGYGMTEMLKNSALNAKNHNLATIFGYHVNDPERYGVVEFDNDNKVLSIEEKPLNPQSNYAVSGLYFYPRDAVDKAKRIIPSDRGELEITDLNKLYLEDERLSVELMGSGYTWLDTGTHKSLQEASRFIETIEQRQGLKIACIEEIAFRLGYINNEQLKELSKHMLNNEYGNYLVKILENE